MARKSKKPPREKANMKAKAHVKPPVGASVVEDEEFEEFREAEKLSVEHSSEFKERLRKKLWKLLKDIQGIWLLLLGGFTSYH
jgi:hypothetical protein